MNRNEALDARAEAERQAAEDIPDILGFRADGKCARCETVAAEADGYCRCCRSRAEAEKAMREKRLNAMLRHVRVHPETGLPLKRRRK